MRSVFIFVSVLLFCRYSLAQSLTYADRLIEYRPAPGQYINDQSSGTPAVAHGIIDQIGNPLSLGAYGGYVVLGFSSGIDNDKGNPYGIDFIIYGNAASNHAEAGIVLVMNDDNQNGIPDETWYEIAGSGYYSGGYERAYSIEYLDPKYPFAFDVPWTDNSGNKGNVYKNSFHTQPYYPLNELFPGISDESMKFTGSRLKGDVLKNNGIFTSLPYAFGYADNIPLNTHNITGIPDNPYTVGTIEGDGGDAIDISWAIDSAGNYVKLAKVNFIRIFTGMNESAGWLGEISTEVRGIIDVAPNPGIKGPEQLILPANLPSKIAIYDTITLSGMVFHLGRSMPDEKINWKSLNPSILQISDNRLIAKSVGEAEIEGAMVSDPLVFTIKKVSVVVPENIVFDSPPPLIQEGEMLRINYSLFDNTGDIIHGIIPHISVENESIAGIAGISEEQVSIIGKAAGVSSISMSFPDFPLLNRSIVIKVIRKIDPVTISFSLGDEKENILPGYNYIVGKTDILSFTDRYQKNFLPDKAFITLADAIVSVLNSEDFGKGGKSFAFRQDEFGGEGLYLWQIGFDWEYLYGWGGSILDDNHAKTWFAIVNNKVFASGFDTLEIFNGDRICLKHIDDNRNPWSFVSIVPGKDKVAIGETVKFRAEQIDIYPNNKNDFIISGPFPVVNGPVLVESDVINSGSDLYTSYTGEFSLSFKQGGVHKLAVGNSEPVLVEVYSPLSIKDYELSRIYPNPCRDWLSITLPVCEGTEIKIFSATGVLKIWKTMEGGINPMDINVSGLEKGIYILEFNSKGKIYKQRICKL